MLSFNSSEASVKQNWLFSKTQDKVNKLYIYICIYVVHLECTTQIGSKISPKTSLQGQTADNFQRQFYVNVLLSGKFTFLCFGRLAIFEELKIIQKCEVW